MKINFKEVALYVLFFISLVLFIPKQAFNYDLDLFISWATHIYEKGLGNTYALENNDYNPFYHYILFLYGKVTGSLEKIQHYRNYLKAFTLVFDFVGAIIAASLVNQKHRRFTLSLLLLFNAGYLYNTLVWGQVDAIFTCFVLVAAVFALKGKPVWSLVFFIIALNAKTQAIIFLPLCMLLWLPAMFKKPKVILLMLLAGILTQVIILAPFIWAGDHNYLGRIYYLNTHAVGRLPYVSMNAFNLWFLLLGDSNLHNMPDTIYYGPLIYKHWGLLLFFMASALALFPLFMLTLRNLKWKETFTMKQAGLAMLVFGIIPLIFCFFNTEMHERYWHPAILFLAAAAFITRNYLLYVIVSFAYFLNLERMMGFIQLKRYNVLIFDSRFIAGLFAIVIIGTLWQIYKQAELKKTWLELSGKKTGQKESSSHLVA